MTNETQQTSSLDTQQIPFGVKLQEARKAMQMDRKDAAAQLRLHEKYIDMMESESFPENMPVIFIRGYIRAYGKLLQLSEDTIADGLAPIKPKKSNAETTFSPPVKKLAKPRPSRKMIMRGATAAVAITLILMLASWWRNHSAAPAAADNASLTVEVAKDSTAAREQAAVMPPLVTAANAPQQGDAKPADKNAADAALNTQLNQAKPETTDAGAAKPADKALPSPLGNKATAAKKPARDAEEDDDYYYED